MRNTLFWVIARRVVVIYYRRFGTDTETSVRNYRYLLCNDLEERSSQEKNVLSMPG